MWHCICHVCSGNMKQQTINHVTQYLPRLFWTHETANNQSCDTVLAISALETWNSKLSIMRHCTCHLCSGNKKQQTIMWHCICYLCPGIITGNTDNDMTVLVCVAAGVGPVSPDNLFLSRFGGWTPEKCKSSCQLQSHVWLSLVDVLTAVPMVIDDTMMLLSCVFWYLSGWLAMIQGQRGVRCQELCANYLT